MLMEVRKYIDVFYYWVFVIYYYLGNIYVKCFRGSKNKWFLEKEKKKVSF